MTKKRRANSTKLRCPRADPRPGAHFSPPRSARLKRDHAGRRPWTTTLFRSSFAIVSSAQQDAHRQLRRGEVAARFGGELRQRSHRLKAIRNDASEGKHRPARSGIQNTTARGPSKPRELTCRARSCCRGCGGGHGSPCRRGRRREPRGHAGGPASVQRILVRRTHPADLAFRSAVRKSSLRTVVARTTILPPL